MSFIGSIKHGFEHAGSSIAHGFEDAGHGLEGAGKAAGAKFKEFGDQVVKEAEHDLDEVEHLVMSVFDTIKHDLESLGNTIKSDFEKVGNTIKADFEKVGSEVQSQLDTEFDKARVVVDQIPRDVADEAVKAKGALESVGKDVENGIADFGQKIINEVNAAGAAVKKDIETAAKALTAEAIEKGIKEAHTVAVAVESWIQKLEDKAPTIVDMLNNQSLPVNLGPLILTYQNGVQRIEDLADALGKVSGQDFELTQEFINDLLHGLGPDTISIHADVEFFVEVGLDVDDIPFEAFVEIADLVFDAIGVPKE